VPKAGSSRAWLNGWTGNASQASDDAGSSGGTGGRKIGDGGGAHAGPRRMSAPRAPVDEAGIREETRSEGFAGRAPSRVFSSEVFAQAPANCLTRCG